ncbi:MAG TPA: sigma 54-interacting transcriptional regulator [Polyangiaceae bacterium]|nr:sigma 54-interacting transcriptional regulator [Polyangiaceae bacterium]
MRDASESRPQACLFLSLEAHRPLAPGARFALGDVDEVAVGRGARREADRFVNGGKGGLRLRVDDPWMSSAHARLVRSGGGWRLEDTGSRNGTLVNGAPVRGRPLADGDVLELGHTFFVYREAVLAPDEPGEGGPGAAPPGLQTLVPSLARAFAELARVAPSPVSVVLSGAVGTGKEVVARAVHALSGRPGAFVAVNCGAIPAALAETTLFGHCEGAFPGAVAARPGLVRAADRGTLFLDEVAELSPSSQVALLRVLQEREVLPVGASHPVAVDMRVVVATQRDLEALAKAGALRADLVSRLQGFTLRLPKLEQRREDTGLLVAALLRRVAPGAVDAVSIEGDAARGLFRYGWPGNVRELEKCLASAVVLAGGGPVLARHLPEPVRAALEAPAPGAPGGEAGPDDEAREDAEQRARLVRVLRDERGNVNAASRALGKAPVQIRRWLRRYGIDVNEFRK